MLRENCYLYLKDGRRLGYLECGDPKGKPVLCFHGYPGSRLDFRWLEQAAGNRGLKLIAVDRPGIGLSDPVEPRSLTDFGGDIEELMERLRLKRPVVMGVSGGGPYVLACLSRLGKKIRAGVVVCGLGPMDTEDSAKGMNASNASLFYCARNYPGTVRFILRITKYMMTKKVDTYYRLMGKVLPDSDQKRMGKITRENRQKVLSANREIFRQGSRYLAQEAVLYTKPWEFSLKELRPPIHFWHGYLDKNAPIRSAMRLCRQAPQSVSHWLVGEGHLILNRHAAEILDSICSMFGMGTIDREKKVGYYKKDKKILLKKEFTQTNREVTMSEYKINTKCVQAGYEPKNGESRVVPIVQSTTFKYDSADTLGRLFDLEESGYFYTRLANPTVDTVAKKIAALEGGVGAVLTSSGQAASMMSVTNICHSGDHVVCASTIYGGTFNLFNKTLRELGIDFTFLPPEAAEEQINAAFQENTRCVFIESLSNPALVVADISLYAKLAHSHGVPLIVDNTFPTPINCRPFEFGADIVVHSTSKYMDGHAVALGGVVVDSGNFDWKNGKFPEFTEPDESYHGVVYADTFGRAAYITKCTTHIMRDMGMMLSPENAFLLNLGLETLFLRVERHCQNAMEVAKFLEAQEQVEWINYPGLPSSRYYQLAQKYMPKGTCGVIAFGVKGGREAAAKLMEALKLASIVIHVADCRTCVLHPASTTHRQLNEQQLKECGVEPNMIRMSVGIEDVEDIIADLKQAFEKLS